MQGWFDHGIPPSPNLSPPHHTNFIAYRYMKTAGKNRERKKLIKSGVDMRERRAAVFKVDEAEIEEHK